MASTECTPDIEAARRGPALPRDPIAATLLALTALAAMAAAPAGASPPALPDAPPPAPSSLVESVSSELVLIETYVTDGLGNPVRGLTRDDFILEVGGLRRPIASVEFRSIAPAGPPAGSAEAAAPAAGALPAPPVAGGEWPRRFVIFFDDSTSGAIGLTQARQAAGRFLESGLAPTDQVAIAANEPPLRLLHDFTTDRAALRATLARDLAAARRGTSFFTEIQEGASTLSYGSPKTIQSYCQLLEASWAGTLEAVRVVATALSGWRGYKSIVFMGDGVPEYPMDDIYRSMQLMKLRLPGDPAMFQLACTLSDELKELSRAAGAAGVTLNTIETRGLNAAPSNAAGRYSFLTLNSLRMLAETTGGISSTQNDFVGAFRAIDRASRDYYLLGYVPEEPADGRYRHIIVRCRRKGLTLRFRRGFTRLPPEEVRVKSIESAHLFPEMHAVAGVTLDGVDGPADHSGRTVDLVLHLPAERLLFRPGPDGSTARVTVGFVGIDAGRHETLRTARRAAIEVPEGSTPLVDGVNCYARVRVPLLAQSITAVAHDEASGWIGAARIDLDADPAPRRPLLGLALYAVGEESLWIEVPADSTEASPEIRASASARGPASRTTFFPGETIVAAFRVAPGPDPSRRFQLDILRRDEVVRSTEAATSAGAAARPIKILLASGGLASGDYRLSVREIVDGVPVERGSKRFRILERDAAAGAP